MEYRQALKYALFEFQNSRDHYRDVCQVHGDCQMHVRVMQLFYEWQCRILAPIAPHFCDYCWRRLPHNERSRGSVLTSGLPDVARVLAELPMAVADACPVEGVERCVAMGQYVRRTAHELRLAVSNNRGATKQAQIVVALTYPAWQDAAIAVVREHYDAERRAFDVDDAALVQLVRARCQQAHSPSSLPRKLIPFAMEMKKRLLEAQDPAVLDRQLPFDEARVLREHLPYLRHTLCLHSLSIVVLDGQQQDAGNVLPGAPGLRFL
jgi:leucyl-tRNA synthetase